MTASGLQGNILGPLPMWTKISIMFSVVLVMETLEVLGTTVGSVTYSTTAAPHNSTNMGHPVISHPVGEGGGGPQSDWKEEEGGGYRAQNCSGRCLPYIAMVVSALVVITTMIVALRLWCKKRRKRRYLSRTTGGALLSIASPPGGSSGGVQSAFRGQGRFLVYHIIDECPATEMDILERVKPPPYSEEPPSYRDLFPSNNNLSNSDVTPPRGTGHNVLMANDDR